MNLQNIDKQIAFYNFFFATKCTQLFNFNKWFWYKVWATAHIFESLLNRKTLTKSVNSIAESRKAHNFLPVRTLMIFPFFFFQTMICIGSKQQQQRKNQTLKGVSDAVT
jgi:hypothetical protein